MMPNPLPQPVHSGFVAPLNDGDPSQETAWLFALGDAYYEIPVWREILEDKDVTVRNLDAARQLEHLSYSPGTQTLVLDRTQCVYSSQLVPPETLDQLAMLAMGHYDWARRETVGALWKGKKHFFPTTFNGLEGVADYSDFMREPEHEISVIDGEQYITSTDWYFPHRHGETSWYLHDFTSPIKILERPNFNGRATSNISRMKTTSKVPADIADSLFLHLRGSGSSLGFVSEVNMPGGRITLPRNLSFLGEIPASAHLKSIAGIVFRSTDTYFIPLEFSDDGRQEETSVKVRCDLLQKEDFESAPRDRKPPLAANQLKPHFDVAADELVAAAWVARQIYTVLSPHKVDIIERDPAQNIRLNFKRIAQMHVMHEGKKEFVGVVYKVGNIRWYVPLNTTGDFRKDQFNPDVPKAFCLKQTSDVVGKIKGDVYGIGNISLSVTKPSGNTLKTLEFAIRQDYRQELKAGKYVIG